MEKPSFKDYFSFSRNERSSIIVLIILIVIVAFSFEIYQLLGFNRTTIVVPPIPKKVSERIDRAKPEKREPNNSKNNKYLIEPIDINHASPKEFEKLYGIGPVLGQRIVKYRAGIRGFDRKEDLLRVYGLTPETFKNIKPFLILSPRNSSTIQKKTYQVEDEIIKEYIRVDINTADSVTLSLLNGIGPKLSMRIINYRTKLGGFDSIGHLKKVYGIDEELYERLEPSLIISKKESKTIITRDSIQSSSELVFLDLDINSASADELEKIKGIGPFYSKTIVDHRTQLGGFAKMEQLKSLYKMDSITYRNLTENAKIKTSHRTFNINNIEFKSLLRMKILEYEEVKYIFNLKKSLGQITSSEQLKNLKGIPREELELLLLYLHFEENGSSQE